jgi:ribosomal protein S2
MIPGNDDSAHCIELFTSIIASASIEGRKMYDSKIVEMKQQRDSENENIGKKKVKAAIKDVVEVDESEDVEVEEVEERVEEVDDEIEEEDAEKTADETSEDTDEKE